MMKQNPKTLGHKRTPTAQRRGYRRTWLQEVPQVKPTKAAF